MFIYLYRRIFNNEMYIIYIIPKTEKSYNFSL
jgi:hypothetical protein